MVLPSVARDAPNAVISLLLTTGPASGLRRESSCSPQSHAGSNSPLHPPCPIPRLFFQEDKTLRRERRHREFFRRRHGRGSSPRHLAVPFRESTPQALRMHGFDSRSLESLSE